MVFLGKNLNMSIVTSMGYCIEVVGKEGQGVLKALPSVQLHQNIPILCPVVVAICHTNFGLENKYFFCP